MPQQVTFDRQERSCPVQHGRGGVGSARAGALYAAEEYVRSPRFLCSGRSL